MHVAWALTDLQTLHKPSHVGRASAWLGEQGPVLQLA
jgi:hypothetical protein